MGKTNGLGLWHPQEFRCALPCSWEQEIAPNVIYSRIVQGICPPTEGGKAGHTQAAPNLQE